MVPDIPHYRVGKLIRFRKEEIDAWMESNRSKGVQVRNTQRKRKTHISIDGLIRKLIDQSNDEVYNLFSREIRPDQGTHKGGKQWVYIKEDRSGG